MSAEFYLVATVATLIVSAARLTRLFTWDKFPPIRWLRDVYAEALDGGPHRRQWQLLAYCGYCASFWITAALVIWGWLVGVFDAASGTGPTIWWLVNGVFAASYVAAIVMVHDGDEGENGGEG